MLAAWAVGVEGEMSLVYKLISVGESHAPCRTPLRKVNGGPVRWEMRMEAVLLVMKFERMRVKKGCMLRRSILFLNYSGQTFSKALETSRRTFVCSVFVLLSVGYSFMKDGCGSVHPSTSPKSLLVVVVEVMWCEMVVEAGIRILLWISRREMGL